MPTSSKLSTSSIRVANGSTVSRVTHRDACAARVSARALWEKFEARLSSPSQMLIVGTNNFSMRTMAWV
eukprot:2825078-Prymnesium_polylepis.1